MVTNLMFLRDEAFKATLLVMLEETSPSDAIGEMVKAFYYKERISGFKLAEKVAADKYCTDEAMRYQSLEAIRLVNERNEIMTEREEVI